MSLVPDSMQQGDPEAIRRMQLLASIMGKPGLRGASVAPPETSQPATPGFQSPNSSDANQPTAPVAQPMTTPKPPVAKPMATPSTAVEPGNQPPAFTSEEEWNKANPAAAHKPYQAPDLKHRLLEGLFAGMQEFGRPGQGAETVRNYLGDIEHKTEEEKNYPATSAAAQHQRYMTAAQGAEQPLHIQQLQEQIKDTQAQAKERAAKAAAEANPKPQKLQHFVIDDPEHPGTPKAVNFNQETGAYQDPDTGKAIPGAKPWEKAAAPGNDFERFYTKWLKDNNQQDTAANQLKAHKDWEIKPEQPGAGNARSDRSYQFHSTQIEKIRQPIEQRLDKINVAIDNLNQKTPQADALAAPEILAAMVGGQGSGLRMNEAEISRVIGGATKWTELKTALNAYSLDPQHPKFTDEQRGQMQQILQAARAKISAKQKLIEQADDELLNSDDPKAHRASLNKMHKALDAIDAGQGGEEKQVHNGFEYTKGADGQWHKGNKVQ